MQVAWQMYDDVVQNRRHVPAGGEDGDNAAPQRAGGEGGSSRGETRVQVKCKIEGMSDGAGEGEGEGEGEGVVTVWQMVAVKVGLGLVLVVVVFESVTRIWWRLGRGLGGAIRI
ncbi:hypothetical protein SLS58_005752 [Diplodia intermedia]|uniref:Uncharacterized protein n=1 Tax=Diplodia intermedia TaxID=856260 RepID=A0ABR3TPV9_9PEZI